MAADTFRLDDYKRYGRQMILDGIGLPGQLKLQQAAVVVVGAGGLGCPALQYLAAAGVGRIGIIDHDVVELSNLQRQTLHTESRLGQPKAESAACALTQINSRVRVDALANALTPANARALLEPYDVILDCTDNAATRYLLSDAAVLLGKPLVSGAAQRFDGQLCTYNLGPEGPCYRCLFPRPAASPAAAASCEETGILGVVTGVIGSLQALEAIKLVVGLHDEQPSLLVYGALSAPPFRSVKLRKRRVSCPGCGTEGQKAGEIEETDYVRFCGGARPDWEALGLNPGDGESRITARELRAIIHSNSKQVRILDVRPKTEFGICHLPSSIHVPLHNIVANPRDYVSPELETYVVCRLGNDSQIAVDAIRSASPDTTFIIKDLVGGLRAWSREVDPGFPVY
ncbi:hypothetical protein F5148DRAFT_1214160 [Russula earlei]|uniref:Uncharacterized protein n=1 Tax=Russula earlei TaxID=71964 RepID=A0ACC0U4V4_9AGAM|nr:hypothetical protein F5148DRAFT_1214160 [Russula earlei]